MKRINITITNEVYADLKSHAFTRDQFRIGPGDAFVMKLVECIEKGLEQKHFFYVPTDKDETK